MAEDLEVISSQIKTISDDNGTVTAKLDWLSRPGELCLSLDYNGFLTQEGMVNFYLVVNGETREFMTMKKEKRNRSQGIRLISFHPTKVTKGINKLAQIPDDTVVDYLLFKNAPYYSFYGEIVIEVKFFIHGRWDGDGNHNDGNFVFKFSNPIKVKPEDHF
jgi:hypothetical protein